MTIELISKETYNRLVQIQKDFPNLTYQNKAYDTLNKSKLTEEELNAFNEVSEVLSKCVTGFSKFNHFKISTKNQVVVRLQYNWGADEPRSISFTGVGYVLLEDLHKGFTSPYWQISPITGEKNCMWIRMLNEQEKRWKAGEPVEEIFPELTPEEREFLKSGKTIEEQK